MNHQSKFFRSLCFLCLFALSLPLLAGCAKRDGKTYGDGDVRHVQSVQYGTLVAVRTVQVKEDPSLFGPLVGGVAGGIIGSLFGGGAGKTLMTLGGAAVGAVAGGATEYAARGYDAQELTIELDSGAMVVVVQQEGDDIMVAGDKVRIVSLGEGKARVQLR